MLKELAISSYCCIFVVSKTPYMIHIIDPITMNMDSFRSLLQACKYNRELKYSTLKNKHLSGKGTLYKRMYIYRVNHSWYSIIIDLFYNVRGNWGLMYVLIGATSFFDIKLPSQYYQNTIIIGNDIALILYKWIHCL